MNFSDYNSKDDDINLYSSSMQDISSSSKKAPASHSKKKTKIRRLRNALIITICLLIAVGTAFYGYVYNTLSKITTTPLDEGDLGIATSTYDGIQNIALLGVDSRQDNNVGRSDAIVILTIDKKHKKLKLSSIARDSYVEIDGHSKDKLTHAYAYGKAQLAVKTLNQNYGLEIKDYVVMNFFELSRVIDYIGGVTLTLNEAERVETNRMFPELRKLGFNCPDIKNTGTQVLNGAQAVCYARIRKIDGDIQRGNRQKDVLMAMFQKVKQMNPIKLPQVAEMVLSECETSFSVNDIMSLGSWALMASPEFEQLSIPNDNIPSKGTINNKGWCYVYDLDLAKNEIKDFIFEENFYSPESVASRLNSAN